MGKAWKYKENANSKRNQFNKKCNNISCEHYTYKCSLDRDFKHCDLYHVRPQHDKR